MKKLKKFLSVFLSLMMVISIIPMSSITANADASSDYDGLELIYNDFEYVIISEVDKTCSIERYYGVEKDIIIPYEINGYIVTELYRDAFSDCYSLENITIPDSITTIDDRAFAYCTSLTSITIPDSVSIIGHSAFKGCTSLASITIPDSVKTIGAYAFSDTAYYNNTNNWENGVLYISNHLIDINEDLSSNYDIKDGTVTIGDGAFSWCDSLTSITIPDSVTTIGGDAFCFCDSLTSVTIPDSVTTIGDSAFSGTAYYNNTNNWENGVLYISNHLIDVNDDLSGNYEIKDGTVTICEDAFSWCTSLTSITIPDSVTTIGDEAFYYCNSLASVIIPNSVTIIGGDAFSDCTSLTSITIPDSVTTIGDDAFYNCDSLTSITVDSNNRYYSSDEYGVLFNKDKTILIQYPIGNTRTSYTIPDSVTIIGSSAFSSCNSLTSVTIPDSVTSISYLAFSSCTSLASITIPDSVTSIDKLAFAWCESLINITIPNSVTKISSREFDGCCSLASVIIPNSVTIIGGDAFSDCTSLTSITIPDSVTSIGDSAFNGCTSLTSITIPDSVTSIGGYAFSNTAYYNNTNNWENGLLYIGNHLIGVNGDRSDNCIIKDGTVTICEDAFYWCGSLTSITIPDSVTTIGNSAFYWCTSLTDVYYSGNEEQWNNITIGSYNEDLTNATIHYDGEIVSDEGIVLFPENDNVLPADTTLNVNLLETTEVSMTYDITLMSNGVVIQPIGTVTVKLPVPDGIDGNLVSVYRCETDGTYTNMNAVYEDGYMVFTTNHFSKYMMTLEDPTTPDVPEEPEYNYSFSIQTPSRTEIRNKDGIILHANIEGNAPEGSYVKWESSNGNFNEDADGNKLEIIAKNKGWTTFTAVLCDADGNELASDSVEMYSKSGFFDKIGGFFRSLFGTTKIYDN